MMNTIYDADFVAVARSFIKRLQPGSMLFEDLIKNTLYDMTEIRASAEGVFGLLKSMEKLSKKSFPQNNQDWNKRWRNDIAKNYRQLMQSSKSKVPHFELNASIERIFMENRDKNILCPPARMKVPENMKDRSRYCAHHEDFGHLTNDCRNLYR